MREQVRSYVSLGSNLGNRRAFLAFGLNALLNTRHVNLEALSGIYETTPVGRTSQPPFLNAVARLSTSLAASELMEMIELVEARAGRKRSVRWGPRTLDIDILAHGLDVRSERELTLPHPRVYEREFVLVPLLEVGIVGASAIDYHRARQALDRLAGSQGVLQVEGPDWL